MGQELSRGKAPDCFSRGSPARRLLLFSLFPISCKIHIENIEEFGDGWFILQLEKGKLIQTFAVMRPDILNYVLDVLLECVVCSGVNFCNFLLQFFQRRVPALGRQPQLDGVNNRLVRFAF